MTLCKTCRFGTVIELRSGKMESYCHEMLYRGRITEPVLTCSTYEHKRFINIYELEKIAWEVKADKSGKIIGFEPQKEKE